MEKRGALKRILILCFVLTVCISIFLAFAEDGIFSTNLAHAQDGGIDLWAWDSNDLQAGNWSFGKNETIVFYANFTNHTTGLPMNGTGNCSINFTYTAPTLNPEVRNMPYNPATGYFEVNLSFQGVSDVGTVAQDTSKTFNYTVNCSFLMPTNNFSMVNASDTVVVLNKQPVVNNVSGHLAGNTGDTVIIRSYSYDNNSDNTVMNITFGNGSAYSMAMESYIDNMRLFNYSLVLPTDNVTQMTYWVQVYDGNTTDNSSAYTINVTDNINPGMVPLTLVNTTSMLYWNNTRVNLTINITDNVVTSGYYLNCSIFINGSLATTDASVVQGGVRNFSVYLGDGDYNWSANCTDTGSGSNVTATYTFHVDQNGPSLYNASYNGYEQPAGGYQIGTFINFSIHATDTVPMQGNFTAYIQYPSDEQVNTTVNFTLVEAANYKYNFTWNTSDYSAGTYYIDIVTNDTLNHFTEWENQFVIILGSSDINGSYTNSSADLSRDTEAVINASAEAGVSITFNMTGDVNGTSVTVNRFNQTPADANTLNGSSWHEYFFHWVEIIVDNSTNDNLNFGEITIYFDAGPLLARGYALKTLSVRRWNESERYWQPLSRIAYGRSPDPNLGPHFITARTDHFSKFGVFALPTSVLAAAAGFSGGSSGGGSGAAAMALQPIGEPTYVVSHYWSTYDEKIPATWKNTNENMGVVSMTPYVRKDLRQLKLNLMSYYVMPQEDMKAPDMRVKEYFTAESNRDSDVKYYMSVVKLKKSWLDGDKSALMQYNEATEKWSNVQITKVKSDASYDYYEAKLFDGVFYALGAVESPGAGAMPVEPKPVAKPAVAPVRTEAPAPTPEPVQTMVQEDKGMSPFTLFLIVALIVIAIALVLKYTPILKKKPKRKAPKKVIVKKVVKRKVTRKKKAVKKAKNKPAKKKKVKRRKRS